MLRTELAQVNQADVGTAPLPEAAANPVQKEGQDFPLVIATMPATERQRTIAVGIVILLTVAAAVIAPFASMHRWLELMRSFRFCRPICERPDLANRDPALFQSGRRP